jgi:hypothetical protein
VDFADVRAVSGCGQQHGSVFWRSGASSMLAKANPEKFLHDELAHAFSVLDSPVWMDSSTAQQCRRLEERVGGAQVLADLTGLHLHTKIHIVSFIYFSRTLVFFMPYTISVLLYRAKGKDKDLCLTCPRIACLRAIYGPAAGQAGGGAAGGVGQHGAHFSHLLLRGQPLPRPLRSHRFRRRWRHESDGLEGQRLVRTVFTGTKQSWMN